MVQITRNLTDPVDGFLAGHRPAIRLPRERPAAESGWEVY
jgi:hypothetical protein